MFEKNEKNIFFTSLGYTLNEFKKSFLLTFIYSIFFFGLVYVFYIASYIFYLVADTSTKANIWFITTIIFSILTVFFLFVFLSRVKKISLLKIISTITNNNKLESELNNINKLLDSEFTKTKKEGFRRFFFFFIAILIEIVIAFGILGIYFVATTLFWQIILFAVLFFTLFPFCIFFLFWSLFCKESSNIVESLSLFLQNYKLVIGIFIFNVIFILLVTLINYILPLFDAKIYLLGLISVFLFTLLCYFNFFCFSQLFLKEQTK